MTHPEPPIAGDEAATLLGSLERQRATFAYKCADLDAKGMQATLASSTMSLGGLMKHLALVEDHMFVSKFRGRPLGEPWSTAPWDVDPDWEWHSAVDDSPGELFDLWRSAVQRSRATVAEALATGGVGQLGDYTFPDGQTPRLRRLLVDLLEEYARHVGHADLIRESVDGRTGEDPPSDYPTERLTGYADGAH